MSERRAGVSADAADAGPGPAFALRSAAHRDAARVAALWRLLPGPGGWSAADVDALVDAAAGSVWVAETDGTSVGFLAARWLPDRGEVLGVAVAPERRRHGAARALLGCAVADAERRGCTTLDLEVGVDNVNALALYRRCGFVAVGRRPRYYRSGEDALLMTRELSGG